MSDDDIEVVNAWLKERLLPEITTSPGIEWLEYGVNKEGYWDYFQFAKQVFTIIVFYV